MKRSLQEVAEFVQGRVVGDGAVELRGISSVSSAAAGDLVFVEDQKSLTLALESNASAIIATDDAENKKSPKPLPKPLLKPLLISPQPKLAFARSAALFYPDATPPAETHPTAVVHSSARLGKNVSIAARAVVGEHAEIGQGTNIGAGCVVGANVSIGCDCQILPNVTIYPGVRLGDRVIIHAGVVLGSDGFGYVRDKKTGRHQKFPQIGRLEIGDDVEIGANSTIDRGALEVTRIGRGTKIDNLVHIGHNCRVGEDVIIAAQTGFSGSIVVDNNVVIGGQVGIGEHAHLAEGVLLGGQSGVLPHKVLRGSSPFWGTPARPLRDYLKQLAVLARLARKE